MENTLFVYYQSRLEYVGGDRIQYTVNKNGGINLVGKLFGIENTYIPNEYIDFDNNGNIISTTICIHDGRPNRIYP